MLTVLSKLVLESKWYPHLFYLGCLSLKIPTDSFVRKNSASKVFGAKFYVVLASDRPPFLSSEFSDVF